MVVSEVRSANDDMHTLVTMFRGDPTQIGGRILTSTKFLHTVPTYPYDIWVQDETSHTTVGCAYQRSQIPEPDRCDRTGRSILEVRQYH